MPSEQAVIIDDFISRYIREVDFFEHVARLISEKIEVDLQGAGVRCIVSHRAKSVARLREKCVKRSKAKPYCTVDDIYDDIVDLAGVRVALYCPDEHAIVHGRISQLFELLEEPKKFPDVSRTRPGSPRFEGYAAHHYRVRLREENANEQHNRYSSARVEIQVASVLMHAWSEVEHDLVYKPADDSLSEDELALLDQLNGLVIAGEIALKALQTAARRKVNDGKRRFKNHYELAAFLLSKIGSMTGLQIGESGVGRVDMLFTLLSELNIDTPSKLNEYLERLHADVERRPLAEQVIDALLLEKDSRYQIFLQVQRRASASNRNVKEGREEVRKFLTSWIAFEKLERSILMSRPGYSQGAARGALHRLGLVDEKLQNDIDRCRLLRDDLVHGTGQIPAKALVDAASAVDRIVRELTDRWKPRGGKDL